MTLKHPCPESFLIEEERGGYKISAQMKHVWAVQIDLMLELVEVCQRHGLRIYADGGTMLGAVRHKGFIPWDDDIDMVMMREDYDKLMQLGDEFKHPYFLQNVYTDDHYTHRHAQLRNSVTACWPAHAGSCPYKYNQGIWVDIFPADNMPTTARAFSHHYKKEGVARQKFRFVCKLANAMPEPIYQWMRNKTRFFSDKVRYQYYEDVMRSVKHNPLGAVCEMAFQRGSIVAQCEDFDEPRMVPFEYIQIPLAQNPDRLLALQYGPDYMTPRQAPSEHGTLAFDTEKSYTHYMKGH